MSEPMAIDQVLAELKGIKRVTEDAAQSLILAETELVAEQHLVLPEAQDDYELIVAMATMEAYAGDAVNGKNQKRRDVELAVWLGNHEEVRTAKATLRRRSENMAQLKVEAEAARREYSILTNRLWALRAMAELHAARLNAMAGVEYQSSRGERVR